MTLRGTELIAEARRLADVFSWEPRVSLALSALADECEAARDAVRLAIGDPAVPDEIIEEIIADARERRAAMRGAQT